MHCFSKSTLRFAKSTLRWTGISYLTSLLIPWTMLLVQMGSFHSISCSVPYRLSLQHSLRNEFTSIECTICEQPYVKLQLFFQYSEFEMRSMPTSGEILILWLKLVIQSYFLFENDKRYVGPFPRIAVDRNHVLVIYKHGEVKFSKDKVLPASRYDHTTSGENIVVTKNSPLQKLSSNLRRKSPIVTHAEIPSVSITEELRHKDLRMRVEEADLARKREIKILIWRGTR